VGGGGAVTLMAFWKAPLTGWISRVAACSGVTGAAGSSRQARPAQTDPPMRARAKPNANLRATRGRRFDGTWVSVASPPSAMVSPNCRQTGCQAPVMYVARDQLWDARP
jgi:hypothetical protein